MKKRYKIKFVKKRFRNTLKILLFLMTAIGISSFIMAGYLNQKSNRENAASGTSTQTTPDVKISFIIRDGTQMPESGAADAVKTYLSTYYNCLGKLQTEDLTQYYSGKDYGNQLINQAALNYLVNLRKASVNDLTFDSCTIGITYTKVQTGSGGSLNITLNLDETVSFHFLADVTSTMCGTVQNFVLTKTADGYQIISHTSDDAAYSKVEAAFSEAKSQDTSDTNEELKSMMDSIEANLSGDIASYAAALTKDRQAFNSNPSAYAISGNPDHSYDRDAAVSYAMKWVDETSIIRNAQQWAVYDDYGGNCCNYVSQCLYAGGIPMDTAGSQIWKWYGETPDNTSSEDGRSPAWTEVNNFYDYCKENAGYGLSADTGNNFYSGNIGDVVIMAQGGSWSHVVVITQVIKDSGGNVVDYLINSNTSDRKNYPLSAYGNTKMELIRIEGWND